jgi:hypothetical protein
MGTELLLRHSQSTNLALPFIFFTSQLKLYQRGADRYFKGKKFFLNFSPKVFPRNDRYKIKETKNH